MSILHKMTSIRLSALLCLPVLCLLIMMLTPIAYAAGVSIEVKIPIEQVFVQTGSTDDIDNRFTYTLTVLDPNHPVPQGARDGTHRFEVGGSIRADIDHITFTHAGLYSYTLKCDTLMRPGYTHDERTYHISIYVRNVGTGLAAEILASNEAGEKVPLILFEHSYQPKPTDRSLMVDPPVRKTVSGNPSQASTFVFSLIAADPGDPMPEGSVNGVKTVTVVGSGETEFGTWSYTKAGAYYYTVIEVDDAVPNYAYDKTVYTITDVVKDVNGQLELARVVTNGSNRQVDSLSFINTYTSPSVPLPPDPPAKAPVGPKTGDYANPTRLIVTMIVSGFIVFYCAYLLYSEKQREVRGGGACA